MNDDLCLTPATELAAAIRSRDVSPVDIVEAVLARIEALNEQVNAFITVDADGALESARAAEAAVMAGEELGPLHGLPVSIKDLEPVAGLRCTYGSKFFEANIADIDGIVTERTKAAGGIIIGKTNACHSGHKDMCDNLIGPPCRNPWKLDRTSGARVAGRAPPWPQDSVRWPKARTGQARSAFPPHSVARSASSLHLAGFLTGRTRRAGVPSRTTAP